MDKTVFEAVGGYPSLLALAHAWHERCLADPIVSHAFSHGFHPQHTERLAAYWAEALGGPSAYTSAVGDESFVVRLHSGNGEHREMDERAETCFALALDDAGIPNEGGLHSTLEAFFHWATQRMAAYPDSANQVPDGLPLPQWSWDGPVSSTTHQPDDGDVAS
jgi:hemoglobin